MLSDRSRIISLVLALSLALTSCSSGVFQGSRGVQKAALEALPKPPLDITGSHKPLPGVEARSYNPPSPPIRPFSVSRTLSSETAAAAGLGALWMGPPAPDRFSTAYPPVGPAFNWSQTENYLLLGTDHRPGWTSWRTDTIMIVGVDRANNRVAVFSVPRDLYVQIPGYGWGRINQVDNIGENMNPGGGPALLSQVLANTLGISTKHYVRVRMDGFVDLVDAIGGVTVHLDCPFYEPIFNLTTNRWDYFALPAGDVWLDGESAYWFVRLRYRESDIGRNQRQREFLWGLRNQMLRTNLLANFFPLYNAFQNMISTDLNPLEILDLLTWGIQLDPGSVRASGLTLQDLQNYTTPEGASVLRIADPARVRAVVEGIWSAPAMAESYRKDPTACPPLPPGVTFAAEANSPTTPVVFETDLDSLTAPEAPAQMDGETAPAEATPVEATRNDPPSTFVFPTPTPAPVSLWEDPADGG
ncbi:LCP family protein [Caldilinea sp.]|uniref:LCP family protein n=1 Tax=Caldilinea sp. TaxID=2293560 RepID=UPI0021DE7552|nr:LCP family protein [Caldilinea sp.]GIV68207.1 MAG: hypothetical protein KatS3mg048_1069 [Caldilinea sp.]